MGVSAALLLYFPSTCGESQATDSSGADQYGYPAELQCVSHLFLWLESDGISADRFNTRHGTASCGRAFHIGALYVR